MQVCLWMSEKSLISVMQCAGWGDIGYVNRWTMEITNNSRHYSIPLVVGRRCAQIVFFDSEGCDCSLASHLTTHHLASHHLTTSPPHHLTTSPPHHLTTSPRLAS